MFYFNFYLAVNVIMIREQDPPEALQTELSGASNEFSNRSDHNTAPREMIFVLKVNPRLFPLI